MKTSGVYWMKPKHLPWLTCNWAGAGPSKGGQREESLHKTEMREGILNSGKIEKDG